LASPLYLPLLDSVLFTRALAENRHAFAQIANEFTSRLAIALCSGKIGHGPIHRGFD
jgi:hypothetical protein